MTQDSQDFLGSVTISPPTWLGGGSVDKVWCQRKCWYQVTYVITSMGFSPSDETSPSHVYTHELSLSLSLFLSPTWAALWRTTCHMISILHRRCIICRLDRPTFVWYESLCCVRCDFTLERSVCFPAEVTYRRESILIYPTSLLEE